MSATSHILIVGSGSVGKRHARNLHALGCAISCCDPREDRRADLASEVPVRGRFASVEAAVSAGGLDGVVIGSPTAFHRDQTIAALEARLPVLLEKPAAMDTAEAREMQAAAARMATPVLLGYSWRWWPPLARVRALLADGAIGQVRHVHFHMSAHLADWHPWERYQDFFMAKRALGGGALLDESHWIDLMLWFFGMPSRLWAGVGHISDLEIDSDDNVDMLCTYPGMTVCLHLDLIGRPHEKSIRFTGEAGTLMWSADPNRIQIGRGAAQTWEEEIFSSERNDMFVGVAREYVRVLAGAAPETCTLDDGLRAMRVIDAVRQSSAGGCAVDLTTDGTRGI